MPVMLRSKKKRVTVGLRRVAADLMNKDSALFGELVTAVRHYTVAFVSIPDSLSDHPWPCGTATLVTVNGTHYFLTAEHVWKKLQEFKMIGITLVADIDQCFTIATQHLMATGPRKPPAEMDGPDMVFLKIPEAKLGEIKARKSFYQLEPVRKTPQLNVKCIEIAVLLGAPGEAAALTTGTNLDLTIQGIMADPRPRTFTRGRYDYIDSKEYFGTHGFPNSYGGFSGGGLWRVQVYLDPEASERKEINRLVGMAFYEFPAKRKYRVIRCHGPRSIHLVEGMSGVKAPRKSKRIILS